MPDGYYLCQEDHPLKRLQLPLDMIGASLDFLDGRSLTQFEMVSRWTRRAMTYEYPDMYKVLLVRTSQFYLTLASIELWSKVAGFVFAPTALNCLLYSLFDYWTDF